MVLFAGCAGTRTTTDTPAAESGGAFPVKVATKFGEVSIDAEPKRVVALGWGDAETALALDVQPVGASDWLAFGGDGVGPWAKDRYTTPPKIIGTLEPSYEEIAALAPDIILDTKSSGDQKRYDQLTKIAPTIGVPQGGDNYVTPVDKQVTMISTALGRADEGKALLKDITDDFAATAKENPQFAGKTITVAAFSSEGWGAYISSTERVQFMEKLGFTNSPVINKMEPDRFSVRISAEKLELLDADLLVVMPIGKTRADVEGQPLFKKIPAVQDGRYLILDSPDVSSAYSINSPLSISYALDKVTPLVAEKVK